MRYEFIAIPDAEVPKAVEPVFQHIVITYASEAHKTVSVWRAVPDGLLDFKPHEKTNPIRTILVHQLLSERRSFAQFVGTEEPPVEELLPPGEAPRRPRRSWKKRPGHRPSQAGEGRESSAWRWASCASKQPDVVVSAVSVGASCRRRRSPVPPSHAVPPWRCGCVGGSRGA